MKNTLSNVLIFAVGAAIGSAVTYYIVKNRYEKEIASLVDDFAQHQYRGPQDADETENTEQDDIPEEDDVGVEHTPTMQESFDGIVKELGYRQFSDTERVPIDISKRTDGPRVINPEEFGTEDYKIVELTYWADGVVTDTKNKRIKDVDSLLGRTLERFGEYEPDALHVRDDAKNIDFEILRDLKKYGDFFDIDGPHDAEDE